jgi:uncharacterized protein (TIGR03083 family)
VRDDTPVRAHLEAVREAMVAFVRHAERAGLRAPVPTTPGWTVRRLVAHQGMVHRWATGQVRHVSVDASEAEQAGVDAEDPLEWLRDGAIDLVQALVHAPPDLQALVFLADAPRPRQFWARRQAHETTVHAVDALAASLGRLPHAAEAGWIGPDVALDGIDELLTGFLPRPSSRLVAPEPVRLVVLPDDADRGWCLDVGPDCRSTTRLRGGERLPAGPGEVLELRGSARALYLTLWNRSVDAVPEGLEARWHDWWCATAGVRWTRG